MINPEDLPFETGPERASLAPRMHPRHPVDPARQARNKHNRQRGRAAERAWAKLLDDVVRRAGRKDIAPAIVMGSVGALDVLWDRFAFEVKHREGDWPASTIIRNARTQAARNARGRIPVVVGCRTRPGGIREWRVYSESVMEGREWVKWVIAGLLYLPLDTTGAAS